MKFLKQIISHPDFFITKFSKLPARPCLVFIHGGPGMNASALEYLIEHKPLFEKLDYDMIFYHQRGCGRSKDFINEPTHQDNINDLNEIYHFLIGSQGLKIHGFIGHSYGAKLLFDFYQQFNINIPGIFVAIADSMLTPRINNLLLDLKYLQSVDNQKYLTALAAMENLDLQKLWDLTEELNPLFLQNTARTKMYWANLACYEELQQIPKEFNLPISKKTFMSVRKDLYSSLEKCSVDIDKLNIPFIWINGLHDYIMNGQDALFRNTNKVIFFKSAHYPHIEENDRFCRVVNDFLAGNN